MFPWNGSTGQIKQSSHGKTQRLARKSYENRKMTWKGRVRKAIRRASAQQEVRKHQDRVTRAWKQLDLKTNMTIRCKQWPEYGYCSSTWMDEERSQKTCIKEKDEKGSIQQPFHGTWVLEFMLRQNVGEFRLGKYLNDNKLQDEFKIAQLVRAKDS